MSLLVVAALLDKGRGSMVESSRLLSHLENGAESSPPGDEGISLSISPRVACVAYENRC